MQMQDKKKFNYMISADSHITEPPTCYSDNIEKKYKDRAPHTAIGNDGSEVYVIDGMPGSIPVSIIAAAGVDPKEMNKDGTLFADLHKGGWDGKARIADQDRDGVIGEIIYPSVGMVLCNHNDADYKQACFQAYNRWLSEEFCAAAPDRLFGVGQTAIRSVEEGIKDMEKMKEMGFKGIMMPGNPATEFDYDDPRFDPFWKASQEMEMPLSFHILTSKSDGQVMQKAKGGGLLNNEKATSHDRSKYSGDHLLHSIQSIILMFIYGGVFDRNPDLKIVSVEADAGWVPHYIHRLNRAYKRHRFWTKQKEMSKMPGEFFYDNVYVTFQDDPQAFRTNGIANPKRIMWANDFPHSDATWPWSQEMLANHTEGVSEADVRAILHDNCAELYNLPTKPVAGRMAAD
jgi:predicted TIM-barrel fold metal-dependent hydrolase